MAAYHDEVEIEDFEYDEEEETYYYPCPCGDRSAAGLTAGQLMQLDCNIWLGHSKPQRSSIMHDWLKSYGNVNEYVGCAYTIVLWRLLKMKN